MLTDDSAGANPEAEGESLFEELKRTVADEVHCPTSLTPPLLCIIHKLTTSSHMPVSVTKPVIYIIFCLSVLTEARPACVVAG